MSDDKNVRLREAVARNDLQGVRDALDDGADIHTADAERYTPLHRAVWFVRRYGTDMLELLLSRGADPNRAAEPGHVNAFELTVLVPDVRLTRRLLEAGAIVTRTAFEKAYGKPEIIALLEEWPILSSTASAADKQLMLAARAGNLEQVTTLLREGADPEARDAADVSVFDHAWTKNHLNVAFALERAAAERDANAELFLATLDDSIGRGLGADTLDLEARTQRGLTALMLAARYRRQSALERLLSSGAQVDQRNGASTALVYAIESGDLHIMQLLLERGATFNFDVDGNNPVLRAACAQRDSELLKQLLLRGIHVGPYPKLWCAEAESERLLQKARAGVLPIAGPPSFSPWSECSACRDLPDVMGWCKSMNSESTGEPLPIITEQFEIFGWSRNALWKCPWCGSYYDYKFDHDNGITDGWDSEDLRRISLERARELLRMESSTPRIEREIASLNEAITFNETVAVPDGKVQIPGSEVKDGTRVLLIYSLANDGAKQVAWRRVRDSDHDALVAGLTARGFAIAETDDYPCDFVWTGEAGGIAVYDSKRKVFEAAGDRATLGDGRIVTRAELACVIAFADDYIYRGIKAMLRSGQEVELVTEYSKSGDPCYSRNELLFETVWCSTLGRAIATWAGTSFENLI